MSGSVNKYDLLVYDYERGMTLAEVSQSYGLGVSTVRYHVKKAGKLRSISEALRGSEKRAAHHERMRGAVREPWSNQVRQKMSQSAIKRWKGKAKGVSEKTNGYVEYTRGPNKGRNVHVVKMENRIGRRLLPDECVHHIDGDKHNNEIDNLALMTRSAHTRLHRREDMLTGNTRERNEDGRFS